VQQLRRAGERFGTLPAQEQETPLLLRRMNMTTIATPTTRTSSGARNVPDFLSRVGAVVVNYVTKSRAERQLEALDDRLLLDIGLSRSEIRHMVWGESRR
jgi:uncharacterized protein YjiS (DUF1127 family)